MGYSNAKPDRRPGDKSKHTKLRVEIDTGNDPVPAGGGHSAQKPAPPPVITGRKVKR